MTRASTGTSGASWVEAPAQLPSLSDAVHVWGARLDAPEPELWRLESVLSAEEVARADRFHRDLDRRRFVAAHGILRLVLGRYLLEDPARIRMEGTPGEKPALAAPGSGLRFNLAHAADVVAIAIADGREVGIDVESAERAIRGHVIGARYFPEEEQADLRALPEAERGAAFLRSWVCKEAFAKATGRGLSGIDVRGIRFNPASAPRAPLEGVTPDARRALAPWMAIELPPLHGCPGALVAEGTGWSAALWLWTGELAVDR